MVRHSARRLSLTLGALVACGSETVDVWVEFPGGLGETLVLVHDEPDGRRISVVEPETGESDVVIRVGPSDNAPVALTFAGSAQAVSLPLGTQPVVDPADGRRVYGDQTAFFTDPPVAAFSLQRRSDPGSAAWVPLNAIPTEFADLAVEGLGCPVFGQPKRDSLQGFKEFVLEKIDESRALLIVIPASLRSERWVVDGPVFRQPNEPQNTVSVARRVNREFWFIDHAGEFLRGDPDPTDGWTGEGPLPVPALESPPVAMTTSGTTADIFATNRRNEVVYYDGRRWRNVGSSSVTVGQTDRGELVSTGFGEALLVDPARRTLNRVTREGLFAAEGAPSDVFSLQVINGVPVVGTGDGLFYFQQSGTWRPFFDEPLELKRGLAAAAYQDGIVFVLSDGGGGFYNENTRTLCRGLFSTEGTISEATILPLRGGLVVATLDSAAQVVQVSWIPDG